MKSVKLVVSLALIFVGLSMWLLRPAYVVPELLNHGIIYSAKKEVFEIGNLSPICSRLASQGYFLITGRIDLDNFIGERQAFFQTADVSPKLFLEYDPGQGYILQFVIEDINQSVQLIKLGTVKRTGAFFFAFMLTDDGNLVTWLNGSASSDLFIVPLNLRAISPNINCDNVRLNAANGMEGVDGETTISISSGTDINKGKAEIVQLQEIYKSSLPNTSYQWPLYLGLILVCLPIPHKSGKLGNLRSKIFKK
jgi:hypothetical protein